MDPRMYKKMIEEGERPKPTAGAGSGLGHISRAPSGLGETGQEHFHEFSQPVQNHWQQYPGGETQGTEGYTHSHNSGLSGVNPVVNPNFNPPPFTQGAVIPHVSGALGNTNLGKSNGKKIFYGLGGIALAGLTFWGAKKFATRKMLEFDDDDMMPED